MTTLGMLDWGIGGLGVLRALRAAGVNAPVVYLSDSGATPYGKLPRRALAARVTWAVDTLVDLGATHVLLACNAASTVRRDVRVDVPLFDMLERCADVVPSRFRGTLAVLGGARTIRARAHSTLFAARGITTRGRIAQPLSALIEAGAIDTPAFDRAVRAVLLGLGEVDGVLLACTHYPAARRVFARHLGAIPLFDPADAVAATLRNVLGGTPSRAGAPQCFTTGDRARSNAAAVRAWGLDLTWRAVDRRATTDTRRSGRRSSASSRSRPAASRPSLRGCRP